MKILDWIRIELIANLCNTSTRWGVEGCSRPSGFKNSGQTLFSGQPQVAQKSWKSKNISIQWKFQGKLCFSGQAQVVQKSEWWTIYIQYCEFKAHSIFQNKHKLLKPEVAGVTFSDSDSAPVPKFLNPNPDPGPASLQIQESDSCLDSGYNHRSKRHLPMFLPKKLLHRLLLLLKWKSDSGHRYFTNFWLRVRIRCQAKFLTGEISDFTLWAHVQTNILHINYPELGSRELLK